MTSQIDMKILDLTSHGLETFPEDILMHGDLEVLYLDQNRITELPSAITQFKNIKRI